MKDRSLTKELKGYALTHGIDLIGITSAKSFVRKGEKETVVDPKEMMADARAVIVTGFHMNEPAARFKKDKDNPRGRFSRIFSLRAYLPMERFYEKTIKEFLAKHGYKAVLNRNYRIPDKMAAVRAGLGKYGKNAVVLTKEFGSCVMFVTLVTDAPLEHEDRDVKEPADCGSCDLCLKACPTGAILESFRVARNLCVTDWLWGAKAPVHLREKQENRIFGCGGCVKACPKNDGLGVRKEYPVETDVMNPAPELIPLLTADADEMRKTIGSFPMLAGADAIMGNVVIALGNAGTDKAVAPLRRLLDHPKPQIRAYSAWALGRIGGSKAVKALENALKSENNREVRKEISLALAE